MTVDESLAWAKALAEENGEDGTDNKYEQALLSLAYHIISERADAIQPALSASDAKEEQGGGWTKMPQLPEPNTLVWCRRKPESSRIYLARRNGQPLAIDPDLSRNCHWYGAPQDELRDRPFKALQFHYCFADGSVSEWCYAQPAAPAPEPEGEDMDARWNQIGALVYAHGSEDDKTAWALCRGQAAEWRLSPLSPKEVPMAMLNEYRYADLIDMSDIYQARKIVAKHMPGYMVKE